MRSVTWQAAPPRRRILASLALTVGALVAVAGCQSGSPSSSTSPTPSTSPSASSGSTPAVAPKKVTSLDGVSVTGKYGAKPTVTLTGGPFVIDKTRAKVLSPGHGATVQATGSVEVDYLGVDAATGKTFDENFSAKQSITFALNQVIPGFAKGLTGQKVGSRVLIGMPSADGYPQGQPDAGINAGDSLVFVVDILSTTLTGPQGTAVTPPAGLPKVTLAKGVPSITIPPGLRPPTKLVVQPLIKGTGKAVAKTDTVTTQSVGVTWSDGKTVFGWAAPDSTALSDTIPGLTTALTGQKVGSRLLVIVPPAQGYPKGLSSPKIAKGQTLVFVVDILFTQPTQAQ